MLLTQLFYFNQFTLNWTRFDRTWIFVGFFSDEDNSKKDTSVTKVKIFGNKGLK